MYFLVLCIICSTGIFVVFKSIEKSGIPSFPVIVINYFIATLLGFLINPGQVNAGRIMETGWLPLSILIGILFIIMFFLIAFSTRKAGISVTTVASKMSVIFPIIFSMRIDPSDRLTLIKAVAIVLTLGGVALTVYRTREKNLDLSVIYIPLILFVGMGVVDSLVKYAQHHFVNDSETALFSAVLFLIALLSGVILMAFFPKLYGNFLRLPVWGWGMILGFVNFGSIFFLVHALNFSSPEGKGMDSSIIFGINNIGIVGLSVLLGLLIFRDRLKPLNWVGIALSILALLLFTL